MDTAVIEAACSPLYENEDIDSLQRIRKKKNREILKAAVLSTLWKAGKGFFVSLGVHRRSDCAFCPIFKSKDFLQKYFS